MLRILDLGSSRGYWMLVQVGDIGNQIKLGILDLGLSYQMILDIGPKTVESIKDIINDTNTLLWNGPAGYFENPNFANGTKKILEIIADKKLKGEIYAVAGGGETVAVINKFNKLNTFNFVSTAGGAFLEYLEGKELPGIKALN